MNPALDLLLSGKPFARDQQAQPLLREALLTELKFQYDNNELYRHFCLGKNFDPHGFDGALEDIPPVAVHVFKVLGNRLASVAAQDIKLRLQSSATSGRPSSVLVDKLTARRQLTAMAAVMSDFIGKARRPFIVVDIDPAMAPSATLGARGAAIRGYLNFASSTRYVMNSEGAEGISLDRARAFDALTEAANGTTPVVVFGFTYVLFSQLVTPLLRGGDRFHLPAGSQVIHIGGWKKLESERVSKDRFNAQVAELFGLLPENVIDVYGFTEQMGINYPDCAQGWKHLPSFADMVVRDPVSRMPLPPGQPGLLEFLTPIPHSYPGNVVLTDDLGELAPDEPCACGRGGRRFRVLGRAKKAEIRGCGDVLAERVLRWEPGPELGQAARGLKVLFHRGPSEQLDGIVAELRAGQEWLRAQRTDPLIGLIDKAAQRWGDPDFEFSSFRERGLAFLQSWCSGANLRRLADFSLRGRRGHLDGFLQMEDSGVRHMRAHPRGLVCHWLSGNVPVLGMLTLVQSIITRNANLLKAASTYSAAVPALLRAFQGLHYTTPGGETLHGDDLLKSIAVVYFDREERQIAEEMSVAADVRLAWGGGDAVAAVTSLPRAWSAQDLIFGPKLSYMVIGAGALQSDRDVRRLARRAATDASVFDQTACASPHTIFVERGGVVSPAAFAERLAEEMDKALMRIPRDAEAEADASAADIATMRALYEFTGRVWSGPNDQWTVLYDEQEGLASPTYSRVITVRPIDDIIQAAAFASPQIQTVGLADSGARRLAFAEAVTARGVERCPDIGMMTNFESPWDGMIVMDRLVRWSTLGGPG